MPTKRPSAVLVSVADHRRRARGCCCSRPSARERGVLQARGRGHGEPGGVVRQAMKLHGFVVDESIEKRPEPLDYRFQVKNGDHVVLADLHRRGARHVQGRRRGRADRQARARGLPGRANGVTAKCPSKYDPDQKATRCGYSGLTRHVPPPRGVRRRERRVRRLDRRRPAPPDVARLTAASACSTSSPR